MTESTNKSFFVSDITPTPVTNGEAQFTLHTSEAGDLDVVIYNYDGSVVATAIHGMHIGANAEVIIPLTLNDIASGIYNVEITINGDRVVRTVVINK